MALTGSEFIEMVKYYRDEWWPARNIVEEAVAERFEVNRDVHVMRCFYIMLLNHVMPVFFKFYSHLVNHAHDCHVFVLYSIYLLRCNCCMSIITLVSDLESYIIKLCLFNSRVTHMRAAILLVSRHIPVYHLIISNEFGVTSQIVFLNSRKWH